MLFRMKKLNLGQSIFEVVLALSIIALIIFAVVILASVSIRNSDFGRSKTLATRYAQGATEWLRGQRDLSWSTFSGKSSTGGVTYCFNTEPIVSWPAAGTCSSSSFIPGTNFQRQVKLTSDPVDPNNVIIATVSLLWSDANANHQIDSVTDFTNFRAK